MGLTDKLNKLFKEREAVEEEKSTLVNGVRNKESERFYLNKEISRLESLERKSKNGKVKVVEQEFIGHPMMPRNYRKKGRKRVFYMNVEEAEKLRDSQEFTFRILRNNLS